MAIGACFGQYGTCSYIMVSWNTIGFISKLVVLMWPKSSVNTCGLRDLVQQRSMVTIYTWVFLHEGRMVLFFFLTQNYLLVRSGGYAK